MFAAVKFNNSYLLFLVPFLSLFHSLAKETLLIKMSTHSCVLLLSGNSSTNKAFSVFFIIVVAVYFIILIILFYLYLLHNVVTSQQVHLYNEYDRRRTRTYRFQDVTFV